VLSDGYCSKKLHGEWRKNDRDEQRPQNVTDELAHPFLGAR
jgi:hypothetical protein